MQEYFFSEVRLKQKKYIFWAWEQKLADLVLLGGPSQFWQLRFWRWPPSLLCFTDLPLQRQVLPAICSHFAAHCSGYRLLLLLLSTRQTHQVQIAPSATHTQTNVAPIVSCGNHNHNYGLRLWAALLLSAKLTAQHNRFSNLNGNDTDWLNDWLAGSLTVSTWPTGIRCKWRMTAILLTCFTFTTSLDECSLFRSAAL